MLARALNDRSIGVKLAAVISLVLVLLLAVAADGYAARRQVDATMRVVAEKVDPKAQANALMQFRFSDMFGIQTAYTAGDYAQEHQYYLGAEKTAGDLVDQVAAMASTPAEKAAAETVTASFAEFQRIDAQIWALVQAGRHAEASHMSNADELKPYLKAIDAATVFDKLVTQERTRALTEAASVRRSADTRELVLIVVGVLLAVGLSVAVTRSITKPLGRVRDVAERMAQGDIAGATGVRRGDEVGQIAEALDMAQANLREVISGVVASADAVAASSGELSASSAQISASAQETAAQSGVVSSRGRRGLAQRADRRRRRRGDGRLDPGDRVERGGGLRGCRAGRHRSGDDDGDGGQAGRVLGGDRQRRQGHHLDRRADQPAGPERDHRGRPGR